MIPISAVITAKDEERRLPDLFESLRDIDDVVLLDSGSTDGTVELARSLGARVHTDGARFDQVVPTEAQVAEFAATFGWAPHFSTSSVLSLSGNKRNHVASLAKHDWVYNPDCDEIIEWDLEQVAALLDDSDQLSYRYHHPGDQVFHQAKIYRRSVLSWQGIVHEALYPIEDGYEPRKTFAECISVEHRQEPKPWRDGDRTCQALEYAAITEDGLRNLFYLGREYMNLRELDKCMTTLDRYLEHADWKPEIAEALFIQAVILHNSGRQKEAYEKALATIGCNPEFKIALRLLAEISAGNNRVAWDRYADSATDEDVLFKRKDIGPSGASA